MFHERHALTPEDLHTDLVSDEDATNDLGVLRKGIPRIVEGGPDVLFGPQRINHEWKLARLESTTEVVEKCVSSFLRPFLPSELPTYAWHQVLSLALQELELPGTIQREMDRIGIDASNDSELVDPWELSWSLGMQSDVMVRIFPSELNVKYFTDAELQAIWHGVLGVVCEHLSPLVERWHQRFEQTPFEVMNRFHRTRELGLPVLLDEQYTYRTLGDLLLTSAFDANIFRQSIDSLKSLESGPLTELGTMRFERTGIPPFLASTDQERTRRYLIELFEETETYLRSIERSDYTIGMQELAADQIEPLGLNL